MNYEELLAARNHGKLNQTQLPIGEYYRMQVDGKYRGLVDIKKQLQGNIVFTGALKQECQQNPTLSHPHQLHFEAEEENGEVVRLSLETGTFLSFEQLLEETPAVVAGSGFLDATLQALADITTYLHGRGIRHLCYSPKTVFARKGDNAVMLLSHGSFYQGMSDLSGFFGDDAAYVAPEVLNHGTVDDRCDVYSIGKFMESLFVVADVPLEYKQAIKRATSPTPEDRYETPQDMLNAVRQRRSTFKSAIGFIVALVVALVCVGIYFELFPETQPVEFVKPVPRQPTDDLLDDGFDPTELGVISSGDSLAVDPSRDQEFQAKAEQIFRKKYEEEADRILSKIYNKEYMSNSEKKFTAESQSTIEELMKLQAELGSNAGLTSERSQLIASEIIDRITEQKKKKQLGGTNSRGVQLPK